MPDSKSCSAPRRSSALVVDEHLAIVDVQAAAARAAVDPPVERVRATGGGRVVLRAATQVLREHYAVRTARAPPAIAAGRMHRRLSRSPSQDRSHRPTRVEAQCLSTSSVPLSDADMRSADAA